MESVGDYEWHNGSLLGHGTFAVVFKGHHKLRSSEKVAVKKIAKKNLMRADIKFTKEMNILKELTTLKHPNIVSLLDCKESHDYIYLVMEFCNAGDLSDYLEKCHALSEDIIAFFTRQIAEGMKALRLKEIVHRDLKPGNILLSSQSRRPLKPFDLNLKIADFGFARCLEEGLLAKTFCGTPLYMAPEVSMNNHYDGKADLWSIGAIIYQCLTGRAPFVANKPLELRDFYKRNQHVRPSLPDRMSDTLRDLILRLLVRNPEERIDFGAFFGHPFLASSSPKVSQFEAGHSESEPHLCGRPTSAETSSPSPMSLRKTVSHSTVKKPSIVDPATKKTNDNKISEIIPKLASRPNSPCFDDYVIVPDPFISGGSWMMADCDETFKPSVVERPATLNVKVSSPSQAKPIPIPIPLKAKYIQKLILDDLPKNAFSPDIRSSHASQSPLTVPSGSFLRGSPMSKIPSIESISPPTVQFMIGSRCNSPNPSTPPPPPPSSSPFQRRGSRINLPYQHFGSSGNFVLPHCGSSNCVHMETAESSSPIFVTDMESQISFVVPDLAEKTIMDKDDLQLLDKLEFIRDLSQCIVELARSRGSPLSEESMAVSLAGVNTPPTGSLFFGNENQRRVEQLLLYVRALQLLGSAIELTKQTIKCGKIAPSSSLKIALRDINDCYQRCLLECKSISGGETVSHLLTSVSGLPSNAFLTTERLLYGCAINMCQSAVMDEIVGNSHECYENYRMAHLLLHSLGQQAMDNGDRQLLNKYKQNVEKRLINLHTRGYVCIKNAEW